MSDGATDQRGQGASSRSYLDHLQQVADADVAGLKKAQQSYGDSWKRRGGVGAFMMLARKWDRLENYLSGDARYDIFEGPKADMRAEGVIDDIRDLRRYLLLVESELIAQGVVHGTHRDNLPAPSGARHG